MDYDEVTAIIKTFMRPQKFYRCLNCVIDAGVRNIIVGYDGPEKYKKIHEDICNHFDTVNIQFLTFPFDFGLSAVRNAMIKQVNTEFLLQLDDDNYIPNNTLSILPFLKKHTDWGGIGIGWLQKNANFLPVIDAFDVEIIDNYFFRTFTSHKYAEIGGGILLMYPFDFISTNALFRTKLFEEFEWDENFKIWGEHEDFFLRVKRESDWKFAYCLSIYAIHDHGGDQEFLSHRLGVEMVKSRDYFMRKWNLKGMAPQRRNSMLLDGGVFFYKMIELNKKFKEDLKNNRLPPEEVIKF